MKCYACGEEGDLKRECPKRKDPNQTQTNYQKRDLANITCHLCRKKGHYANKCPQRKKFNNDNENKKAVTFESAHLTQTGEESCSLLLSLPQLRTETVYNLVEDNYNNSNGYESEDDSIPPLHLRYDSDSEDESDDESEDPINFDLNCRAEETAMAARANRHRGRSRPRLDVGPGAFMQGDFAMWLLDSGASCHFTPVFEDLLDPTVCDPTRYVRVADGTLMQATHQGTVELRFTSNQGDVALLRLLRVLYVPGLQTRLFSIESFISNSRYRVVYEKWRVTLEFRQNPLLSVTIMLPHVPPGTYVVNEINDVVVDNPHVGFDTRVHRQAAVDGHFQEVLPDGHHDLHHINMVKEICQNVEEEKLVDDSHAQGGEAAIPWKPINWENKSNRKSVHRMNVELGHVIFGHRAVSSLLAASRSKVWDDVQMTLSGDSWCNMCRVAIAPKNKLSKVSMKISTKPLEMIFLDAIPSPGTLRCIPECHHKQFLFLTDPVSKYVEMLPAKDYKSETHIKILSNWRSQMVKKGFPMCFVIRTDAGSNFTSKQFADWCKDEMITLTIAGPKHQEQNAFVEKAYGTASRMARSMLVNAHLPMEFYQLALRYACKQLRVLPAKGLVDCEGNPTTTYAILNGKKPKILRFKVFGCPVVFKRYMPYIDGKATTEFKELQQGTRGVFVGFPINQAGWLIFVQEKVGDSHLVISADVVFDQFFLSGISASVTSFAGSQNTRKIGNPATRKPENIEQTGDVTNLADYQTSHWGGLNTFNSDGVVRQTFQPVDQDIHQEAEKEVDDSSSDTSEADDETNNPDLTRGSTIENGLRRSRRLNRNEDSAYFSSSFDSDFIAQTIENCEHVFSTLEEAANLEDIDITPYLPEPKNL
jgi:hypothetical protein